MGQTTKPGTRFEPFPLICSCSSCVSQFCHLFGFVKQLSNNKPSFSCGTMVEVMEKTNDVVWVPSIIVKEMEDGKSFIVKSCKYLSWNDEVKPTRTVSLRNIRPVPPPLSVENYELMEPVEVFVDPGWRLGIVKDIL